MVEDNAMNQTMEIIITNGFLRLFVDDPATVIVFDGISRRNQMHVVRRARIHSECTVNDFDIQYGRARILSHPVARDILAKVWSEHERNEKIFPQSQIK